MFKNIGKVERRTGLTPAEFLRDFVKRNKPVILTDAVPEWRALSEWSPNSFRIRFGDRKVSLRAEPERKFRLDEYLDRMLVSNSKNPAPYLFGFEMAQIFPELLADLKPDIRFAEPDRLRNKLFPKRFQLNHVSEMLIGGMGTTFPLHFDIHGTHGFVTQVYGSKEFTIFSPDQSHLLYPNPRYPNKSLIADIECPDMVEFPLFAEARPLRAIVRPGETIFHPGGWWHTTRLLDSSIGIVRSTVTSEIWCHFVREYCRGGRGLASFKGQLKAGFLIGMHPLMTLAEFYRREWR